MFVENRLLAAARGKNKKGGFDRTQTAVSYNTGFPVFDHRNGYIVEVKDLDGNLIEEYPSTGIMGGSIITIIGKSGTAKSTYAIQIAANIIRPFDNGFVQHYDLEQATTYTRVRNVTGLTQRELTQKYILKQTGHIEDIRDAIVDICKAKSENKDEFMYDTKLKDEFGEQIRAYVPTVFLLDSLPRMSTRDSELAEMEGATYSNRVVKALTQFYARVVEDAKQYNIIIIAINHIKKVININPMQRAQPQLNYLAMDEYLPMGDAPVYYANTLVKFTSKVGDKLVEDKDGFDGMLVRCDFLKSRTNKAGQFCNLVFNQDIGFDPIHTLLQFAIDNEVIKGSKNPHYTIDGLPDVKFDTRKFRDKFLGDERIRFALYDKTLPILESQLSKVDSGETAAVNEMMEFLKALRETATIQFVESV